MAFVEVADVITQTGVDADWSGLSAMPSVTTTTYGTGAQQVTHYFIPDPVRITCQGTVSHDPDKETLIFDRDHVSFPALVFEAGLRLELRCGTHPELGHQLFGRCRDHQRPPQRFPNSVQIAGTMNWNGGTIITGKQINFANGSFIEQYAGTIISTNTTHDIGVFQTTVSPPEHAKIVVRDLVLDGHTRPALYLPLLGVGVVRLRPRLGAVTIPPFSVFLLAEFEDFNVSEARVTFPYLHARTPETGVDSTNFINASDPFRSGSKNASTNVFGYVRIFRDVALDLKDLAGAAASEVAYYLADVDSGNRRTIDTFSDGDQVYSGVTSGGTAVLGRVLHAVHTIQAPETEAVYDNRTPSALDILTFLLFGYEYAPVPVATPMYGNGLLTVDQVMLPDASITEPVKATVDAYATIDNSAELYDAAKAYLHDNYAGELAPLLTRNGTTVDLDPWIWSSMRSTRLRSLSRLVSSPSPQRFSMGALRRRGRSPSSMVRPFRTARRRPV